MTATPCHHDDYPETLRLLTAVVGHRSDAAGLGFDTTERRAWGAWDELEHGKLSSTEQADVRIGHWLKTLDWAGGPGTTTRPVLDAVTAGPPAVRP